MEQGKLNMYLRTFVNWLLFGLAAGFLLAAAVTWKEYHDFSELTGAVIRQETEGQEVQGQDSFAAALKKQNRSDRQDADRKTGEVWLEEYGYRTWGRLGENFLYASGICVLFFEAIGWGVLLKRKKEEKERRKRIDGLSEYLLAANLGKAGVLQRREDEFSCLEDEIYKTVMELKSTKEEAVHNHEVLSERIADIAHQLKTPLASMTLMAELLEAQQTEETKEYLERLMVQIRRLQNLVSALLSLAKLEAHAIQYKVEELDIEEMIEEAAEPLQELVWKKQVQLVMSGEKAHLPADRQWTEEAVLNVLKNCTEHSPEGGKILIHWSENPLYTEIQVTDNGKGFSRKDLPHLFERFYRGEGAGKDSAGIGLALAKLVMEQQNGYIRAENTADGHARFLLRFYR